MVIYYTTPQESLTVTSAHSSFQSILTPNSKKKKKKAEFYRVDKVLNSTYHSSVPVPLFLAPITTI